MMQLFMAITFWVFTLMSALTLLGWLLAKESSVEQARNGFIVMISYFFYVPIWFAFAKYLGFVSNF